MEIVREWAGRERLFRLTFGSVLDLEQAIGEGVGHVFMRLSGGRFHAADIYHVLRLGLIGGGMGILDAKRLLDNHFDNRPGGYMENASVAGEIIAALMVGIEDVAPTERSDVPSPHKFSQVSQICAVFNMSPADLRAMRYADFVNMVKGYNAASEGKRQAPHLTEDEFQAILDKYEPQEGD
jgi:hypothetical protein